MCIRDRLKTLLHLRDLGNTLIVVEHDEDTMLAADCVVDIEMCIRDRRYAPRFVLSISIGSFYDFFWKYVLTKYDKRNKIEKHVALR